MRLLPATFQTKLSNVAFDVSPMQAAAGVAFACAAVTGVALGGIAASSGHWDGARDTFTLGLTSILSGVGTPLLGGGIGYLFANKVFKRKPFHSMELHEEVYSYAAALAGAVFLAGAAISGWNLLS